MRLSAEVQIGNRACPARSRPPIAAPMRKILSSALVFLLIGPVPGAVQQRPVEVATQVAAARPVVFARDARPARPGDQLRFVQGWHLTSPHSQFGGFSGLALIGPQRFQLIGDNGTWVRLTLGSRGHVSDLAIKALPALDAYPRRKAFSDAEALAYDPASGKSWVALEGLGQIWRLDAAMTRVESRRRSPALFKWPANQGPEAMARLADGGVLLLSEDADEDARGTEGLLYRDDPAVPGIVPTRFFYDAGGKGLVSDAAALPDGRVLIVHRRLGLSPLFTTILAVADPAEIGRDGVWRSREIGRVPEALRENYEGAAIGVEAGRTFIWLVSDHNFNSWQRSLLLKFELVDVPDSKKAAPSPAR